MKLLSCIGIDVDYTHLDRYYSTTSNIDKFGNMKVVIIPKKFLPESIAEEEDN